MRRLLALAAFSGLALALDVLEEDNSVRTRSDRDLQLTCTGSEAWDYCRWSFFSRSCARSAAEFSEMEDRQCAIDPERITWTGMPEIDNK